jgi:hypothetical protein
MISDKTIDAVAAESGVTKDEVAKVIQALESVQTDPAVGQVRHNPATGDVAIFVRQYGETYWSVVSVEDRHWVESDTVGWDVLVDPVKADAGAVVTTPGEAAVDPE